MFRTHRRVLEVVKAVVCEDEPPSLPGFHSASWQEEQTGSHNGGSDRLAADQQEKEAWGGGAGALCSVDFYTPDCLFVPGWIQQIQRFSSDKR